MNIKRMNIQFYMEDQYMLEDLVEDSQCNGRYLQIDPIVHRDGVFKRGKDCWFEIRGQAFTYDSEMFDFEFGLLNVPSLSTSQFQALKMVVEQKLASVEQKKLYQTLCYNLEDLSKRLEIYKSNKRFGI